MGGEKGGERELELELLSLSLELSKAGGMVYLLFFMNRLSVSGMVIVPSSHEYSAKTCTKPMRQKNHSPIEIS